MLCKVNPDIILYFINTLRVLIRCANALMEARCIKQVNCL